MTNDLMLGGVYILMAMMLVLGSLMSRREPAAKLITMALTWIVIFGAGFVLFTFRDDFGWVAVSARTRGVLWNAATGDRVAMVRDFDGAYIDDTGSLFADLPRSGQDRRSIMKLDPQTRVLGKVNEGFKVVMSGLDLERAFFAVSMVGGLEAALEVSLKYAKEREQFGQPIANFQLIQAKLADMYTDLEAARLMAHRSMWLAQQGKRVSKEAAAALLFTARAAMRAADEALQIHGGWGYLTDFEVEKMWRNAKLGEIGAGTNEIRQLLIARELLGMR